VSRKIIYIVNPISGTKGKQSLQALIEKKTTAQGIPYFIYPSVANGDYSFLHDIIREEKVTDVVAAGGDGTVSQVIHSLQPTGVNFGIIPCGSGNSLALATGIPKARTKALQLVFDGKTTKLDAFTVNEHFSCMLCGIGFDAKVAHDFAKQPTRGLAMYIKQSALNFFAAKSYAFEMGFDKQKIKVDAYFVSIANSNQFGNNVTIAPRANLSDGLLDIVIVTKQNKVNFVLQTLRQVTGFNSLQTTRPIDTNRAVIYFQTDKIKITNQDSAPLHIDGEPLETDPVFDIHVKKDFFKLIHPE
jgi:diacylglycerol kinase (ATP)